MRRYRGAFRGGLFAACMLAVAPPGAWSAETSGSLTEPSTSSTLLSRDASPTPHLPSATPDSNTTSTTAQVTTQLSNNAQATSAPRFLSYRQAPILDAQVASGKLPPVEQRLPENPAIVTPIKQIGKYGGSWRLLGASVSDLQLNMRMGYEPLVRWDQAGKKVVPGVAESWEMLDGGRTFVFHLRKGMKWSDGEPFTSADFVFTANEIVSNPSLSFIALSHLKSSNELPTVEAVDTYTVKFRFKTPYGNFPQALAFQGLQHDLYLPSHYVKKHHPNYISQDELNAKIKAAGQVHWSDYLMWVIDLDKNPDLPTVAPFKIQVPYPSARCVAVRNPYYYKVDTEGNQLPYIDELVYSMAFDPTVLNLKAMNGETDFQLRRIDSSNFTMFKERGRQLGYRVLVHPSTNPICIYLNQYSPDETLRPILQDRRFRQALSLAIDRSEIVELVYSGLAEPSSGFIVPEDPYYLPGMDKVHTEYNPAKANQLLDEMGLKRGASGIRKLPNGKDFSCLLQIYPSEEGTNPDMWQLVSDYWREIGIHAAPKQEDATLSFQQATSGMTSMWSYVNAGLHWGIEGLWKVPISIMSYMAPKYGAYYQYNQTQGVKPPPEIQRMVDWYVEMRSTPDDTRRTELAHKILKQWAEECYVIGICRAPIVAIVSNRFHNIPSSVNYDYRLKSPGYLSIEQFYIDEENLEK